MEFKNSVNPFRSANASLDNSFNISEKEIIILDKDEEEEKLSDDFSHITVTLPDEERAALPSRVIKPKMTL